MMEQRIVMYMGKSSKSTKQFKTQAERIAIATAIKQKFLDITGVDMSTYESEGIQKFSAILYEYANTETLLSGFSGKIYIEEIKRYIEFRLPLRSQVQEHVALVV